MDDKAEIFLALVMGICGGYLAWLLLASYGWPAQIAGALLAFLAITRWVGR